MTIKTLQMIDSLLEEHVMKQQISLDKARKKINEIQQKIDDNPEKESELEEIYNFWLDSKKNHFELLCNAENAYNDFRNHDWR